MEVANLFMAQDLRSVSTIVFCPSSIGIFFILSINLLSVVKTQRSRQRKNTKKITNEITGQIWMFSIL
jgi:hypothetical protein